MKRILCLILSTLFAVLLPGGCAAPDKLTESSRSQEVKSQVKSDTGNKAVGQKPLMIACIVNQDDQYMKLLQLGMSDAAKKAGAQVILANTYGKLDKEIELINTYITSGVDGICIHPVSVDLSVPILRKAKDSGVKVISAGIRIEDRYQIGYIESDQTKLGEKTGQACRDFIEKQLGGYADIAILNYGSQFPEESTSRTEGFESELTKLPGVKVVAEQEAWLAETAVTKAGVILASQPEINIIWAANEGGTVGAAAAVKNTGKAGHVFVFGTDVSEPLLNMLLDNDNILQAVTGQQPYEIGYRSLEQLVSDIQGKQMEGETIISGIPLSRSNQEEVMKYIGEFRKMIAPAN